MTQPADLPYPVPEPHEWADDLDPGVARALSPALADLAAGRSVVCTSEQEFDTLLDAQPQAGT